MEVGKAASLQFRNCVWLLSLFGIVALFSRTRHPKNKADSPIHPHDTPPQKTEAGNSANAGIVHPQGGLKTPDDDCKRKTPVWEKAAVLVALGIGVVNTLQYCANYKAASAARDAADVGASQLELSERPWVDADIKVSGPLYFNVNGANLNVLITLRNTGHSPAVNTTINPGFMLLYGGPDPRTYRNQLCAQARNNVTALDYGTTLFPNATFPQPETITIPQKTVGESSSKQKGKMIWPVVVVCTAYGSMFNKSIYTTAYIMQVTRLQDNNLPTTVYNIGEDVPQNRLVLQLYGVGSIYAN